jgi:hypothetical protein
MRTTSICLGMLAVAPGVAVAFSPALHANVLISKSSPAAISRQARIGRTVTGALGARATATLPSETIEALGGDASNVILSGLNGIALAGIEYPSKKEVFQAIPEHCFKRDTVKSMGYATVSAAMVAACVFVGLQIPLRLAMWPLWLLYSMVTGTVATGAWVIAHECGHGAFSDNKMLQDAVSPDLRGWEEGNRIIFHCFPKSSNRKPYLQSAVANSDPGRWDTCSTQL